MPHRLPGEAASRTSFSCAMLPMSGYAIRSIIGHVSPPSTIRSVVLGMLLYANAATRTAGPSAVSQTDCLAWPASAATDAVRSALRSASRIERANSQHDKRSPVFLFGLKRRFSAPACRLAPRRAQRRSRLILVANSAAARNQVAIDRLANCETRVLAKGVLLYHSATLTRFTAAAVITCCNCVFANPT